MVKSPVNKLKVYYGLVWYVLCCIGYALMNAYNQGLQLETSKDMFLFTASECLFMVSMAFSYFYSYQTYAIDHFQEGAEKSAKDVVVGVEFREVLSHVATKIEVLRWRCCLRV